MSRPVACIWALSVVVVTGCTREPETPPSPPTLSALSPGRVGLSDAERAEFYRLEEGSEVFPLSWFLALEKEPGAGEGRFAEGLDRFGFINEPASGGNPFGLPIGITVAGTRDLKLFGTQMIGVNCAACHVAELEHQGKRVRLDGAGGRADISAFYSALAKASVETVSDKRRFLRFLGRLRASAPSSVLSKVQSDRSTRVFAAMAESAPSQTPFDEELEEDLIAALIEEDKRPAIDISENLTLSPGAAAMQAKKAFDDALVADVARTVKRHMPSRAPSPASVLGKDAAPQELMTLFVPAAITDAVTQLRLFKARLEFLLRIVSRMNVSATDGGFGRIDAFGGARNLLFTSATPQPSTGPVSYPHLWNFEAVEWLHWDGNTNSVLERNIGQALGLGAVLDVRTKTSTVSVVNLYRLEQLAKKIRPPKWQDTFGPVDPALARRGQALFVQHCASCHDTKSPRRLELAEIGTDPNRAENFAKRLDLPAGEGGDTESHVAIARLMTAIKLRAFDEKGFTPEQRRILDGGREPVWRSPRTYDSRPLIAPWASAPYLHNNSVLTLADLLLPPDQRPSTFRVGTVKYDPVRLGYVSEGPGEFDTSKPGNSNKGHNYGTALTQSDRTALLEYLKGI